jgi:hypothetical protein
MPVAEKGVAADIDPQASGGRATLDHAPHVDAVHRQAGENARLADERGLPGRPRWIGSLKRGGGAVTFVACFCLPDPGH